MCLKHTNLAVRKYGALCYPKLHCVGNFTLMVWQHILSSTFPSFPLGKIFRKIIFEKEKQRVGSSQQDAEAELSQPEALPYGKALILY